MPDIKAYTYRVPGNHRHAVVIDIDVYGYVPKNSNEDIVYKRTKALIDTGASKSSISGRLSKELKIRQRGKMLVVTAAGAVRTGTYVVNVTLPNGFSVENAVVSQFRAEHEFDFIIGLDILLCGDMAITNANGETVFSFRTPPASTHTDYTLRSREEHNTN